MLLSVEMQQHTVFLIFICKCETRGGEGASGGRRSTWWTTSTRSDFMDPVASTRLGTAGVEGLAACRAKMPADAPGNRSGNGVRTGICRWGRALCILSWVRYLSAWTIGFSDCFADCPQSGFAVVEPTPAARTWLGLSSKGLPAFFFLRRKPS